MKNHRQRAIYSLPLSEFEVLTEIIAVLTIVFSVIVTYKYWDSLPANLLGYINLKGQVEQWNGKGSFLFIPIGMIIIYFFITVLEKYPYPLNYLKTIKEEIAENQYRIARQCLMIIKTIVLSFFSYFHWQSIQSTILLKENQNPWFILIFVVAIFSSLGYYIYKLINNSEVI